MIPPSILTNRQPGPLGVLQELRSLVPPRPLNFAEACARAELQASAMLAHFGVTDPAVPVEIVTELPRIRVEYEPALPVSGSAYWDGRAWVIGINEDEPYVRQRFSLLHEFKHILDHPTKDLIRLSRRATADIYHERLADYFAACVLMPRPWVKQAWCGGMQDLTELAERFEVSTRAMSMRLDHLGLRSAAGRSHSATAEPDRSRRWLYTRASCLPAGALQ